jgi:hypothetical protein
VSGADLPSPRDRALAAAEAGLRRAFADTGVVERPGRVGDADVDLLVRPRAGDGTGTLLALDVIAGKLGDGTERMRRMAALGVSDYWQVLVDPSREAIEMVTAYRDPEPLEGRFRKGYGTSLSPDIDLRLASTADVRVPADTLQAVPCARPPGGRAEAKPPRAAELVSPGRCTPITFTAVGEGAPAELHFADFDAEGLARRFRFNAESAPLGRPLDLAATGLRLAVRGPFQGQTAVDAVLPAGRRWIPSAAGTWTYRGRRGEPGGIARVDVRPTPTGGLRWDVAGERAAYAVPRDVSRQWGRIEVAVASGEASGGGPCGSLFFHAPLGCHHETSPAALVCRGPEAASPCRSEDPDGATECALRGAAHAEELFFAAKGRFFTGPCDLLQDLHVPDAVVCTVVGTSVDFSAVASHPSGTHRNGCRWESQQARAGSPMRCF